MKLIGPFSEIRLFKHSNLENTHLASVSFPIKDGGILLDSAKIIEIDDFAILYSKYKEEEIEIEEIEEHQILILFDSNL